MNCQFIGDLDFERYVFRELVFDVHYLQLNKKMFVAVISVCIYKFCRTSLRMRLLLVIIYYLNIDMKKCIFYAKLPLL